MKTITCAPADFDRWLQQQGPKSAPAPAAGGRKLPTTTDELADCWRGFMKDDAGTEMFVARNLDNPDDGVEHLIQEFENWLQKQTGCLDSEIKDWADDMFGGHNSAGDHFYDYLLDTIDY